MLSRRTCVVLGLRSKRSQENDSAPGFRVLRMACIVLGVCVAAVVPAAGQGFSVIDSFAGFQTESGAEPNAGLVQGTDGNFYGTTAIGGSGGCTFGCGTIYRITADGTLTILYNFQGTDGGPSSGLIQATNGLFYGATAWRGGNCSDNGSCGSIYEITAAGARNAVYNFPEPAGPLSGVIQASDGNLYGSTYYGGTSSNCSVGCGTIFKLTLSGTFTTLYNFSGTDGSEPGVLIQATDGNFYGTTALGGAYGQGTIFQLTPGGTLTTIHSFGGADGFEPVALIQAQNGSLYGITVSGGANNSGTAFEMSTSGSLTTIYSFCAQKGCSDGNEPWTLMQTSDGNLYGTTIWGGTAKDAGGTIFEISGGTLTTLHKFVPTGGRYLGGESPIGALIQSASGNFYGTTSSGGAYNNCGNSCGTVFTFGPATATPSQTSMNFGNQALNERSSTRSLTLKNSGVTLLNVSNVSVSGEFAIATDACTGAALTSEQKCKVTVTFAPAALGVQSGTLTFSDNTGTSPQSVSLSGTGVEPTTLTPATATYGKQLVGTTSPAKTLTLLNEQNFSLTGITISTTGDFAISATTCTTTLAAKQQCKISVTFMPTQTGTRSGMLSVSDSASNSPEISTLKGAGTSD
jgi:uncharacterized repeat protein (TIGR03803 family)